MADDIEAQVETGTCKRPDCNWTGFHWHWGERRFRSIFRDLDTDERARFNTELGAQTQAFIR